MSDAQAPAGWFPDPEDPAQLRYWDGTAWTEHRHPAEPAAPEPAAAAAPPAAPQYAYQPTYGAQPGYAAPYGSAPAFGPPQNVLALVGMILAIAGTAIGFLFSFLLVVALTGGIVSIFGLLQANRMRREGTPGDRRGLALAGIIVGFGGVALGILLVVLAAIIAAVGYSSYY
jgi:hypothetical protein